MFSYDRYLHFRETDAAGVLYFGEVLNLCHEAYEASLRTVGIDLKLFFSATDATIVPIVHAAVDFFQPLYCGDRIWVDLRLNWPRELSQTSEFELTYTLYKAKTQSDRPVARAKTHHVCLETSTRQRQDCSLKLREWLTFLASENDLS